MKQSILKLLSVVCVIWICPGAVQAADRYWTTGSCAVGGTGTWDLTTSQWSPNSTGGSCGAWVQSDNPRFRGTAAYTVTIGTTATHTFSVNKMFVEVTPTITLANGSPGRIAFTGTDAGVDVVSGGRIDFSIIFTGTVKKTGAGRLETGNTSQTAKWIAAGGAITMSGANRLTSTGSDAMTFDGGGFGIGWGSTFSAKTWASNRGVTINSGGAFFGASASANDLIIQSPIIDGSGGTGNGGLNVTTGSPMVSGYTAGGVVNLQNTTATANSYKGPTSVASNCKIVLGAANQIPNDSVLTMATGSTVDFAGFSDTVKSLSSSGGGALTLGAGTITLDSPTGQNAGSAVISGVGGKVVQTTGIWTTSSGSCTYDGGFTLNGGTNYLAGNTAYGTGTLTINGGKIAAANANARAPTIPVNLAGNVTFGETGKGVITFATGAWSIRGASGTIRTITTESVTTVINSAIGEQNVGNGLIKEGTATLTLGGVNTYTGPSIVNGGRFRVDGSLASSAMTVNSGGTLGGTGTVNGETTIADGGELSPGANVATIGTLVITTNLILSADSTNNFAVDISTLACDKVVGISNLTCGGTLAITHTGTLTTPPFTVGAEIQLFEAASYSGSFSAIYVPAPLTAGSGLVWDTSTVNTDGKIRLVPALPLAYTDLTWTNATGGDLLWSTYTNWWAPANAAYAGSPPTNGVPSAITVVNFTSTNDGAFAATNGPGLVNNIVAADTTVTDVSYNSLVPAYHTMLINPGVTLAVTGVEGDDLFSHRGSLNTNTDLSHVTIRGAGRLVLGNTNSPFISAFTRIHMARSGAPEGPFWATMDMSDLDYFAAAPGHIRVGASGSSSGTHGTWRMAKTNLLILGDTDASGDGYAGLVIGQTTVSTDYTSAGDVQMGQENVFQLAYLRVGGSRATNNYFAGPGGGVGGASQAGAGGTLEFQSGLVNPTLTVRGVNGVGPASVLAIGDQFYAAASSTNTSTGVMDLTGGTVDIQVNAIRVGRNYSSGSSSTRNGGGKGTLTWTAGTISSATTTHIGRQASNNRGNCTGVVNVQSNAVFLVNDLEIGGDAGTGTGTCDGTLNIVYGGQVIVTNNVLELNDAAPSGTSRINLTNGTLTVGGVITVDTVNVYSGDIYNTGMMTVTNQLSGAGAVHGPVTVDTGGVLAPGNSIGTLTVTSNLTLTAFSASVFEVNTDTLEHDMVVGISNLTIAGTLYVSPSGSGTAITNGASAKIFEADSYSGSFAAIVPATPGTGLMWDTTQLAVDGTISVACDGSLMATNVTYQKPGGATLKIYLSQLLTNVNQPVVLAGVGSDGYNLTTTNGITLTTNATFIAYDSTTNVDDSFTYTVNIAGCVATGTILIQASNPAGIAQGITTDGSSINVSFSGIPGYQYDVERAEDVNFTVNLTTLITTNVPANGQFTITDPSPPVGSAFYRLKYNP